MRLPLKTLRERAQRIHSAMWCRGFDGNIRTLKPLEFGRSDYVFILGWVTFFLINRFINLPLLLGGRIMGYLS